MSVYKYFREQAATEVAIIQIQSGACAVITPPLIPLTTKVTWSPSVVSSMLVMIISSADTNVFCL